MTKRNGDALLLTIRREFDQTRELIMEHHEVLKAHIVQDEAVQRQLLQATARYAGIIWWSKWILSGGGLAGALAAYLSYLR